VRAALASHGVTPEITVLGESAHSAALAAEQLGIGVAQICNSLVFAAPHAVLLLTSGAHRVDTALAATALDVPSIGRASADLVRSATGFAIGGVAPVGHPTPLPTLVDADLAAYDVVWAAAGHPRTVFPTSFDELLRITSGTAAALGA
jgi:prolyl-tRNA editing enzyme YbaK/EbsC (Cys-tRNA(Pro) deacylase)